MDSNEPITWRVKHPEKILHQYWEGEDCVVVYDGTSGNTHLLSLFAGEVLGLLMSDSHTVDSLLLAFSNDLSGADDSSATGTIENVLSELRNIDLVCNINR